MEDTATFIFIYLDFVHSFSIYDARSETEQSINSIFEVTITIGFVL